MKLWASVTQLSGSNLKSTALSMLLVISIALIAFFVSAHTSVNDFPVGTEPNVNELNYPRLFLDDDRLEEIREAITVEGSHHHEAFHVLKDKVAGGFEAFEATETNWNYARSYLAQSASFLYQITGDREYTEIAYQTLVDVHEDPDPDGRLPEEGYGLARATVGLGFALAYDWSYDAWTREQRDYILERIIVALDAWEDFEHPNIDTNRGSNWTAVCRGGELIMMLAAGEEEHRQERFEIITRDLIEHMSTGYDDLGVTQEGIGYTTYAGIFLLPAIYAAKSVGDERLYNYAQGIQWYKQAMYAGTFIPIARGEERPSERGYLMSGVGGPTVNDEGWASLLLNLVPEEDLPYFLWWYDRHMGKHSLPQEHPEHRYDHHRQGTMWALLYYPQHVNAKDPSGVFPKAISGERGQSLFRNRWKDPDDILATLIADGSHHSHAWSQSEAGQIGLIGWNTLFIGGPHQERDGKYYSKVLVNGEAGSSSSTGKPVSFEAFDNGGYAIIDGDEQYEELGVGYARRHMLVRFSDPNDNEALIAVLDRLKADSLLTLTWNLNYGSHDDDFGLVVQTGNELTVPTFTLQNADGATFYSWVILPEEAEVEPGQSIQITKESESADFLTVGWVGQGTSPPLEEVERGANGIRLLIGDWMIVFDRVGERLLDGNEAREFDIK